MRDVVRASERRWRYQYSDRVQARPEKLTA